MSSNMILKKLSPSSTIHAGKTEAALVTEVKDAIKHQLRLILARDLGSATKYEIWMATSLAVKEMMIIVLLKLKKSTVIKIPAEFTT